MAHTPHKRRSDRTGSVYIKNALAFVAIFSVIAVFVSFLVQRNAVRSEDLHGLLSMQRILIIILSLLLVSCLIMAELYIFRPLRDYSRCIHEGKSLPISGIREMRTFASSYNAMFEQTKENHRKLSYAAAHDAITGLFNRAFFESVMNSVDISSIALLIIDVDKFKQINDIYGHKTGDMALMRVAATLRNTFRAADYVCRIGGDEFAVIMLNTDPSMEDVIKQKTDLIRENLKVPAGDVPPIFVSFGCAFGEKSGAEDLFSDADKALYLSKHTGGSALNISQ